MRRLTFFLAAVLLVLVAETAPCREITFSIDPTDRNSLGYSEMRVEDGDPLSIRRGRFLSVDPANFWQVRPGDKAGQAKLQDQLRKPQAWNRYAYVSNNPINAVDPDGREAFVITTFDYGIGSHSAVLVARSGDNVLYDPAGSYVPESLKAEGGQRGSGDMFYGEDADLKSYVAYQKSTGSEVKVLKFNTTPQQEAQIKNRIEQRPGSTAPGSCTQAVCSMISGVGAFRDVKPTRWPGRRYERLKDLLTR